MDPILCVSIELMKPLFRTGFRIWDLLSRQNFYWEWTHTSTFLSFERVLRISLSTGAQKLWCWPVAHASFPMGMEEILVLLATLHLLCGWSGMGKDRRQHTGMIGGDSGHYCIWTGEPPISSWVDAQDIGLKIQFRKEHPSLRTGSPSAWLDVKEWLLPHIPSPRLCSVSQPP